MLPAWCILFAVLIRLTSGSLYTWGILRGKARPNPITWLLWGMTAMIAFVAQLYQGVGISALATFTLGLSPLIVFVVAVIKQPLTPHLTRFTFSCAACAMLGILLWQVTSDANLAIIFSIIADIFANLPTPTKAYRDPSSEYGRPYMLSIAAMVIILLTLDHWTFASYAFPLYMLAINVTLVVFATIPLRRIVRRTKLLLLRKIPQAEDEGIV